MTSVLLSRTSRRWVLASIAGVVAVLLAGSGLAASASVKAKKRLILSAPVVVGSIGAGSNIWWTADSALLILPTAVASLSFQITIPLTPGVAYTGGWSTLPRGAQESEATTASAVVCSYTSAPGTVFPGRYIFVCGFNTDDMVHPLSLDSWSLQTTDPTASLTGPMQALPPGTTTTTTPSTTTTVAPPVTTVAPSTTVPSVTTTTVAPAGTAGCGLAQVAFCDTFNDDPPGIGNRSGGLDGTVWGVSREVGAFNNLGQGQYDAVPNVLEMQGTCPNQLVTIETDIMICNGQLNEVTNDNPYVNLSNLNQESGAGTVTSLAMYPKQPFDFAGRTGKIVFDVSDDSGGSHTAWPELWVTSAPTPDPFAHLSSWQSLPQNGFGIRLDGVCTAGQGGNCGPNCPSTNTGNVVTVNDALTVNNYVENDPENGGDLGIVRDGCVTEPTAPGQLNHFEVDVSQNQIDVYGTNAGTTSPLIHLATIPNVDLGFTRGLVWLEDDHYNANKGINAAMQAMHTFTWDNVGFDGPVLPRDLAFDAADNLTNVGSIPTLTDLGWPASPSAPATITVPGVTGVAQATGGLLTLNFFDPDTAPVTLSYSLNGNATNTFAWPFADSLAGSPRTVTIPISLSEVVSGTNTIQIWSEQDSLIVSNVDLVMQGAGGIVQP